MIPSFKTAVERLTPGEKITTKIPANKAYSPLREDMIFVINKSSFPEGISPKIGQKFQVPQENGNKLFVTIKEIKNEDVKLDANHLLAGMDLTFEIELVKIC